MDIKCWILILYPMLINFLNILKKYIFETTKQFIENKIPNFLGILFMLNCKIVCEKVIFKNNLKN